MKLLTHPQNSTVIPLEFGDGYVISFHISFKGCNYLSMLGLKLKRVSKRGHGDWYPLLTYSVMFKHLRFDSFVADIGLYLSCFSTGIKSAHTFYKTYVFSVLQWASTLQRDAPRPLIPSWISDLQPANQESAIMRVSILIVLKNETHASPLNLFLGLLIF